MQRIEPVADARYWSLGNPYPPREERLRDGTPLMVRPLAPEDAADDVDLAPSRTRGMFRFLGQAGHPSDEMMRRLSHVATGCEFGFAAVAATDGGQRLVGVGRYGSSADGSQCECAVFVRDGWSCDGVDTALLGQLLRVAQAHGIKRMWSIDSVENRRLDELCRFFGFERRPQAGDTTQVVHSLWLD